MGNVKLCDCTLSASEFYFNDEELDHILDDLQKAGVDVIELGLACQKNFRINSCLFYDSKDLGAFQEAHEEHLSEQATYSILLDTERLPDGFLEFDRRILIRAQIWPGQEAENLAVCQQMIEQGFQVILCPMETGMFSDAAFDRILEAAVQMKALGVYIVDLDQMDMKRSLARIQAADQILPPEMLLGYHGTDCTGESLEMAKKVSGLALNRTVLLDASVCGLSNRATKLRSEILADFLNECCGGSYEQNSFLSVYDHALSKHYRESVLLRYLSAKYHCSHRYAEYYHNEIQTTLVACAEILQTMPEELRWDFSKKAAYQLFRDYSKQQMDLAVIIPTCNRSAAIDNLLFQSAYQLRKYGVDVIIYDSSDDDKTENVVRNFQLDGCWNVFYHRYQNYLADTSLEVKVMDAYREYADQYRYLWVCGESIVLTPDTCVEKIRSYIQQKFDCIIVDAKFRNGDEKSEKIYAVGDALALFKEQGKRITMLGTLIFSSDLIQRILDKIPLDERTCSLWQMAAPLHYYEEHPFSLVAYVGDVFIYNAQAAMNSFGNMPGKEMEQWTLRWYTVVNKLPACYDKAKDDVLKIELFDFHPFYLNSLMKMRGDGELSIPIVKKYKCYLPCVSDTALWKYYAIALMPKWVARFLSEHQKGRIFRSLRQIYLLASKKSVG